MGSPVGNGNDHSDAYIPRAIHTDPQDSFWSWEKKTFSATRPRTGGSVYGNPATEAIGTCRLLALESSFEHRKWGLYHDRFFSSINLIGAFWFISLCKKKGEGIDTNLVESLRTCVRHSIAHLFCLHYRYLAQWSHGGIPSCNKKNILKYIQNIFFQWFQNFKKLLMTWTRDCTSNLRAGHAAFF